MKYVFYGFSLSNRTTYFNVLLCKKYGDFSMKVEHNPSFTNQAEEYVFKIEHCGNAYCDSFWGGDETSPPYTRLYYIVDGQGEIFSSEGRLILKKGRIYMIPAGYSFSYRCEDMQQLYFHINLITSGGADLLRGLGRIFSMPVDEEYIKKLLRLYESEDINDRFYLKALLQTDVFSVLRASGVVIALTEYSECVQKALVFIGENLTAGLTIKAIAESIFVSPDTLAHRFKKELGVSVGRYIDELIMSKAENLLVNTTLTVAQISSTLGFYDQFYFSRRFKEKYFLPPLKYRKTHI